jgi:methionine--tRNA ligase beta chain
VNQYDRLFLVEEPGKESGDFLKDLNPDSFEVLENVLVEPSVVHDAVELLAKMEENASGKMKVYPSSLAFQFERSGYFALDKESTGKDNLVFNRVVTLKDTWGVKSNDENAGKQKSVAEAGGGEQRTRGRGQQQPVQNEAKVDPGDVEDVRRVALRAVTILEAGPHPEADSLVVCKVDAGDKTEDGEVEPRTIVAGLAGKIPFDELVGSKVVAVTNLKPAKMRGIESTAMLLAATDGQEGDDETVELLKVPDSVPNGELLNFEGKDPSEPDVMMKSKGAIKAFERVKAAFKADENGEAVWVDDVQGSVHKLLTSNGPVKTKTLVDSIIQ